MSLLLSSFSLIKKKKKKKRNDTKNKIHFVTIQPSLSQTQAELMFNHAKECLLMLIKTDLSEQTGLFG